MKTFKTIFLATLLLITGALFYNCSNDDEGPKGNFMEVYSITPNSPADMEFDEFVLVEYNYNIVNKEGARMWVIPMTDGEKSPGYKYSSSKIFTGNGARQVGFSIDSEVEEATQVDELWVVMKTPDQEETLFETFIKVNFTFDE